MERTIRKGVPRIVVGTLLVAGAWLAVACASGDDDESSASAAPGKTECTPVGDACGPRGSACCQVEDGPVQCLDGTCGVCKALQAECSGVECCDGARCQGNKCCSMGGCETSADCCGGRVCGGQAGCCIPAGAATSFTPECCSGRAMDKYCKYPDSDSTYYCGTECL
jgi:hypothetical protein